SQVSAYGALPRAKELRPVRVLQALLGRSTSHPVGRMTGSRLFRQPLKESGVRQDGRRIALSLRPMTARLSTSRLRTSGPSLRLFQTASQKSNEGTAIEIPPSSAD